MAFQIAVENAIKHNIASEETPLKIQLSINENVVIITNNLNEKQNFGKESKFGHKYLESIYKYYCKNDFKAFQKRRRFYLHFTFNWIKKNIHSRKKATHSILFFLT